MQNNNNGETTGSPKTFHQRLDSLKWRKPDRQKQPAPPDSHRGNKKRKSPPVIGDEITPLLSSLLDVDTMPVDENDSKQADALRCEVCVLSADSGKKKAPVFPRFVLFIYVSFPLFLQTSEFLPSTCSWVVAKIRPPRLIGSSNHICTI